MGTPLRVLFVEDSDDDTQLIIREIRRSGYDVEWERIDTQPAMQAALTRQAWDLVLSDHTMPEFSSVEALSALKNSGQDLPFIVISGSIGEDAAISALKAGAHDFLIKGNWARLIPAIQRELREAKARREHRLAREALQESEQRFRALVETGMDEIVVFNSQLRPIYMSPSVLRASKYSWEEMVNAQPFSGVHPDDQPAAQDLYEWLLQHPGQHKAYQLRLGSKGGHIRWTEGVAINLLDDPSVKGIVINYRDITQRKRVDTALRQAESKYRALVEQLPAVIYLDVLEESILDGQFTTIYVSPQVETLLGYAPAEFASDPELWAQLIHEEDREDVLARNMEHYRTKQAYRDEYRMLRKDGQTVWVRDEAIPVTDQDGERWFSQGVIIDITERKQHERELEAIASISSTLRLAKTLDELHSQLLDQVLALVGVKVGSIWLYDPFADQINLAAHQAGEDTGMIAVKSGENIPWLVVKSGESIVSREFCNEPGLGAEIDEQIPKGVGGACVPLYAEERVIGAILVCVQLPRQVSSGEVRVLNALAEIGGNAIHRLHLYEQTIRQLERLEALRMIDLAITSSFDLQNSLKIVIDQVVKQLGVHAASVLLMKPEMGRLEFAAGRGFHTDGIEATSLRLGEDYAGQAALEKRIIHISNLKSKHGRFMRQKLLADENFVSYFGVPLIAKGEAKGVLEIFHRSSLSPNAEWWSFLDALGWQTAVAIDNANLFERLQRSNAELELRVTERTKELNRINAELERANRTKDEFLANMSHELRTPLNSILGLSESLLEQRRDPLSDYQQKSLQIIESSGRHLLELISDILDLSKIEAGMFDYYPQVVEVDTLCRSSLAFVKQQATRKNMRLTYEEEKAVSRIYADPRRLKQILVNLLTNAVKFTPERGQVTLRVEGDVELDLVQFSVTDNGIGIRPEDLKRLFHPFVQVDSALNRQFEGTGLGLALVQKLTDLHGGSVSVESEAGQGSRFTIHLPWGKDRTVEQETSESGGEFPIPEKSKASIVTLKVPSGNCVVLLAEDNMANNLTIGGYLKDHGYEIVSAHDGLEAIEKAEEIKPDIILMDIQMPTMNGLDAIRRLRQNPLSRSTPIIALTALAMPGDRERCLQAGANEYLSKPVSLKRLLKTMEDLI